MSTGTKKPPAREGKEAKLLSRRWRVRSLLRELDLLADGELGPVHAGIHGLEIGERDAVGARDGSAAVALLDHIFAGTGSDRTMIAALLATLVGDDRLFRGFLELRHGGLQVHEDRPDLVETGHFRQDLYEALGATRIVLPPLRERAGDIPGLTRYFLARIGDQPGLRPLGITDGALALLQAYDWPGNVRQLQAVLFRAAVFCDGDALTSEDFP